MTAKKAPQPTENDALLPQSAPPPYEATAPLPSSSHAPSPTPPPPRAAYGPTPVASLPPPPPALWHASTSYNGHPSRSGGGPHAPGRPYARADARARRRFCGAIACAFLVWFAVAAICGAVLGEELVRRGGGGDGRYAVRWRRGERSGREPLCLEVARRIVLKEGTEDEWVLADDEPETPRIECMAV
ncbi:hypothetical protein JCM3775_005012 [Rhodotorula graminis]